MSGKKKRYSVFRSVGTYRCEVNAYSYLGGGVAEDMEAVREMSVNGCGLGVWRGSVTKWLC